MSSADVGALADAVVARVEAGTLAPTAAHGVWRASAERLPPAQRDAISLALHARIWAAYMAHLRRHYGNLT